MVKVNKLLLILVFIAGCDPYPPGQFKKDLWRLPGVIADPKVINCEKTLLQNYKGYYFLKHLFSKEEIKDMTDTVFKYKCKRGGRK